MSNLCAFLRYSSALFRPVRAQVRRRLDRLGPLVAPPRRPANPISWRNARPAGRPLAGANSSRVFTRGQASGYDVRRALASGGPR